MRKLEKYELMYIKFSWAFIFVGIAYIFLTDFRLSYNKIDLVHLYVSIGFIIYCLIANGLKQYIVKNGKFSDEKIYYAFRIIEISALIFAVNYVGIGQWAYIILAFPMLVTTLYKGTKDGIILATISALIHTIMLVLSRFIVHVDNNVFWYSIYGQAFLVIFNYVVLILFTILCGRIYSENFISERENSVLLERLGEKYEQLTTAQEEIKQQYERSKDTNSKLEETNKKLTSSIAEFFTVQQITQAISSIFDIKELLRNVNDIIIGVMGVNNSSIILYDEKKKRLKVHTTSIREQSELITLNDNINCQILLAAVDNGKQIIENFVDSSEFAFTKDREVNSLICVPLSTKSGKFGLVLIEQKHFNAFDDSNVRLLDIIGQQVGIAIENAVLYQKMQDLATIDGLTGIYNRLYFQDRLKKEIISAQDEQYKFCLAIFDIDHFKKFNDTYGHLFGDKVLKSISSLVKTSLRSSDVVARFGGEEFIILFPRTTLNEAYEKVELLRKKIESTSINDELVTASVTVSFGISCYPDNAVVESQLLRMADDALYSAKSAGRNCVMIAQNIDSIDKRDCSCR